MRALKLLPALNHPATIYDMGCGPGHSSVALAAALQQKIIAVDLEQPFLDQLQANAASKNLSHLIEVRRHDMLTLSDEDLSIDLIWAEGSIYCAGFDTALKTWRRRLRNNGMVACTELSWLTNNPADEAKEFWQVNYPQARSIAQNIAAAEESGFTCLEHFVLPESAWWDEYYNPTLANIERLTAEATEDKYLAVAIAEAQAEIDLYRNYSADYGYVFYLLKKSD